MRRLLLQTGQQASNRTTRPLPISSIAARIQSIRPQKGFHPARINTFRNYSTEHSQSNDGAEEKPVEKPETETSEDPMKKELEAAKKEIIDLKDKYLRSVADFRNLQTITKRQIQSDKEFAISKFAKDLLDSVDNLDRALATVPEAVVKDSESDSAEGGTEINQDLRNLYSGLKMTESVLMNTLSKHGLTRFDPSAGGERFDPNIHDASFMAPQPDKEDGTVFATIQKGFKLNGRVVRAAKVGVVKNS